MAQGVCGSPQRSFSRFRAAKIVYHRCVLGRSWGGVVVALVVVALGGTARAGRPPRDAAQERAYADELAAAHPNLPKLPGEFAAATQLMDDGKLAEAADAFRKIAEAAPRHAPTLWRLSGMERMAGHRDQAIEHARAAVSASDRWQARSTLAEALITGGTSGGNLDEAQGLLDELRRVHPGEDSSLLAAELAVHRNDVQGLKAAVAEIDGQPSEGGPGPDYFRFVLAVAEERWSAADEGLSRAVARGLPAEVAEKMRNETGLAAHLQAWRWTKIGGVVLAVWLGGLLFIYGLGLAMSRRRWRLSSASTERTATPSRERRSGSERPTAR